MSFCPECGKKVKEVEKSQKLKELELELTLSNEKLRIQANEMFIKGLLTKKEFKDEINRINNL
jgi:transcription initiation factor IIE alpha subunit